MPQGSPQQTKIYLGDFGNSQVFRLSHRRDKKPTLQTIPCKAEERYFSRTHTTLNQGSGHRSGESWLFRTFISFTRSADNCVPHHLVTTERSDTLTNSLFARCPARNPTFITKRRASSLSTPTEHIRCSGQHHILWFELRKG